jgi:hypothetical protein
LGAFQLSAVTEFCPPVDALWARAGTECSFYLIDAEFILSTSLKTRPSFQMMRRDHHQHIQVMTLTLANACAGLYRDCIVTVSRRWEPPVEPDGLGVQMQTLREYLRERPGIKHVFYGACRTIGRPACVLLVC